MGKKKIIVSACAVLLAAAAVLSLIASRYLLVNRRLYPKDAQTLDLRGQTITLELYEELTEKLPNADIQFDVSFQGSVLDGNSTEVQIDTLTAGDAELLASLPKLRNVRGENCRDFDALLYLKQLKAHCEETGIVFRMRAGNILLSPDAEALTLHEAGNSQIALLHLMPQLKTLHLTEPMADGEKLAALVEALPDTCITWEKTILGLTFSNNATEIDLIPAIALGEGEQFGDKTAYQYCADYPVLGTKEEIPSSVKVLKYHPLPNKEAITGDLIAEVESAMAYFPKAEKLIMCGSVLDNEAMAAFRERHREDYKVVWMVQCGEVATRTDATFFMPTKYYVFYFLDKDAPNLKYCEDIVSMDIGHMLVRDLSFVEYMPNLKYLVITLSDVREVTPLASCKNLVFLEMDWTRITDYSPLLGCTALEDLNVGGTCGDVTPLCEMTWLKNLWLVKCGNKKIWQATEALPDTHIGAFYDNPDDGWRQLPNYYNMRDALLMYYML